MRFTTLSNYPLIDVILIFTCLLDDLIQGFCYSILTRRTGELELASTITFVLQANQLTKCASHPESLVPHITINKIVSQSRMTVNKRTLHLFENIFHK